MPDELEQALGWNPRSTDSDGDGKPDQSDSCPIVTASTGNGCPDTPSPVQVPVQVPVPGPQVLVPTPIAPAPLRFTIAGVPARVALSALRSRGLSVAVTPSEAASFSIELCGRLRGARIARSGDVVLGEARLARAAGRRTVRVRVASSQRKLLRKRGKLELRVTATDALGRTVTVTRRVTIR